MLLEEEEEEEDDEEEGEEKEEENIIQMAELLLIYSRYIRTFRCTISFNVKQNWRPEY